jgi:hypothetical protein
MAVIHTRTEAEFLDVIGKKVLIVFLVGIHRHLYKRIFGGAGAAPPGPARGEGGGRKGGRR